MKTISGFLVCTALLAACDSDKATTEEGCPDGIAPPDDGTKCSPIGLQCLYPNLQNPECGHLRTDCVQPGVFQHWDGVCVDDGPDSGTEDSGAI